MAERFLDKAYDVSTDDETVRLYDDWSETYEAEVESEGYVTPRRCAEALAQFCPAGTVVLDFGCGTGLSGLALRAAGYATIDGVDVSPEMLAQARAKGIYRATRVIEPGAALPVPPEGYGAVAAIGVIGAGAAPIAAFDLCMEALGSGGKLVLSLNDHALAVPENEAKLHEYLDSRRARLLFREHGDHLPGIDLSSTVFVIEKT